MSRSSACLGWWPGLFVLWREGRLSGVVTAIIFAILLNGALLATFVAPEWVPSRMRYILWGVVVGGWWLASRSAGRQMAAATGGVVNEVNEDLFLRAQEEYLRGHWYEAESPLRQILKTQPEDADARIFLAGLLRRSARYDEARRQLGKLAKMPHAHKWEAEIQRELNLLPGRSRTGIPPVAMAARGAASDPADRSTSRGSHEGPCDDETNSAGWGGEGFKDGVSPDTMRRAA